ncbi:MAG: hypothetical protein HY519_02520, partial [Candidatus Aenigmarchaeota archaeon]|nr:hypothetical protein [Candidatus Aenigmarchaeota archaeon]
MADPPISTTNDLMITYYIVRYGILRGYPKRVVRRHIVGEIPVKQTGFKDLKSYNGHIYARIRQVERTLWAPHITEVGDILQRLADEQKAEVNSGATKEEAEQNYYENLEYELRRIFDPLDPYFTKAFVQADKDETLERAEEKKRAEKRAKAERTRGRPPYVGDENFNEKTIASRTDMRRKYYWDWKRGEIKLRKDNNEWFTRLQLRKQHALAKKTGAAPDWDRYHEMQRKRLDFVLDKRLTKLKAFHVDDPAEADNIDNRLKALKEQLRSGAINEDTYLREKQNLYKTSSATAKKGFKKRVKQGYRNFVERPLRGFRKLFPVGSDSHIWEVFNLLTILFLGAVVTSFTKDWDFMIGFLSLAGFYVLPLPPELPENARLILKPGDALTWRKMFSRGYLGNHNAAIGFMRSLAKTSAIYWFSMGFVNSKLPFANIGLIVTVFVGYFFLKMTYDAEKPSDVIESLLRFFLGAYFIPFVVIDHIFHSMVLTMISLAFFAIPPIAEEKSGKGEATRSQLFSQYLMYDRILFSVFMMIALIGSGSVPAFSTGFFASLFPGNWQLTGALKATFIYFWTITGIAGFFSSPQTRPTSGFVMLGVATIIYGLGPGTQQVGAGLFGVWFPTVYSTFTSVTAPVTDVFGQLGDTFGTAMTLLVDPVGFANDITNPERKKNAATGEIGA